VNPFGMRRRLTTIVKECVVKLFTEAYKLKTNHSGHQKSRTSNNLTRENTGDDNKK
jgi:hypothetical protein